VRQPNLSKQDRREFNNLAAITANHFRSNNARTTQDFWSVRTVELHLPARQRAILNKKEPALDEQVPFVIPKKNS
jgi:hypothetical protein